MTAVKEFGEELRHMENINANRLGGRRVLRMRQWTPLVVEGSESMCQCRDTSHAEAQLSPSATSLCIATKSSPHSPQLEKAHAQKQSAAKNK